MTLINTLSPKPLAEHRYPNISVPALSRLSSSSKDELPQNTPKARPPQNEPRKRFPQHPTPKPNIPPSPLPQHLPVPIALPYPSIHPNILNLPTSRPREKQPNTLSTGPIQKKDVEETGDCDRAEEVERESGGGLEGKNASGEPEEERCYGVEVGEDLFFVRVVSCEWFGELGVARREDERGCCVGRTRGRGG